MLEPFSHPFMQTALLGALLAGGLCAIMGSYVVLRQMAFLGDALAHTILPGIVLAWFWQVDLFVGGLVSAVATALFIGWLTRRKNIREDTAIGIVFSAMFALGVLMMSMANTWQDFHAILFGNLFGIGGRELIALSVIAVIVLATLAIFHKELELSTVDPVYARQIGINPDRLRMLLLVLVALAVVGAIQAVGVLLTSALLITPAASAALLSRSLLQMMAIGLIIAILSAISGLYASYYADVAAGASIVLCCTAGFVLCWGITAIGGRRVKA